MKPEESQGEERGRGGLVRAFRIPYFAPFWLANVFQFFSSQIFRITQQWLVTELTDSRTLLGLVGFVEGTTVAIGSPIAGVAADRYPKRRLLASGRLGMAAIISVMTALVWADSIQIWHILVLSVAAGALVALMQPASQTYVYDIVGRDGVQNAVALNSTATGAAQMVGPALAGGVIALAGIVATFVSAAAGMAIAAAILAAIPITGGARPHRRGSALRDLREGFSYVVAHPPVLLALVVCTMAVFNGALFAMRPIFARHVLEVGSVGFGTMAAAGGLGTVAGALVAATLPTMRRPGVMIAISMLGHSAFVFFYAFAFSFPYVLAVEFGLGVFSQLWQVSTFSGLQMAVPEEMRGRVIGMVFMVVQLAPIGQLAVGALADAVGDQLAMGIFGFIPTVLTAGIFVFGYRQLRML